MDEVHGAQMEPIHLVKKYYGERFAFYFAYFVHYKSLLLVPSVLAPSVLGVLLYALQMYWLGTGKYGQTSTE